MNGSEAEKSLNNREQDLQEAVAPTSIKTAPEFSYLLLNNNYHKLRNFKQHLFGCFEKQDNNSSEYKKWNMTQQFHLCPKELKAEIQTYSESQPKFIAELALTYTPDFKLSIRKLYCY
jgi:hypothetical protein